jgi:tetratricopeptide (TPR) repeat protein
MSATAKRVRRSTREDQLVTTAVRLSDWAQTHFNQVIIGVVVLVAIIAVLVFAANSRNNSAQEGERQMGSALALMEQGDINAARATFQQVAERRGGKQAAAALFFMAECDLRQNNFEAAQDAFDAYLARSEQYPMFEAAALMGRGLSFEGTQEYGEAAASMGAAVEKLDEKDPRCAEAAFAAGEFYQRAGQSSQALKYFEIAARVGTGDLKARAEVAVDMLGD